MSEKKLSVSFPAQGWKQFLTSRKKILDAYDSARSKAKGHEIETYHGRVGEPAFRKWLSGFLPKRYGVTPGYIISQGVKSDQKAPHFDVIIYDVLNSPVLWIEEDADTSHAGRSMAIPAEHVLGVIEVKSKVDSTTASKAIEHLGDLKPILQSIDEPNEKYKLHLPPQFFCALVFMELSSQHEYSEAIFEKLLHGLDLRGFTGGLVLRGEGHSKPMSGRIKFACSKTPIESTVGRDKTSLLKCLTMSNSICVEKDLHFLAMLNWEEIAFSRFAFDLVAIMQGTFDGGASSFHGMGNSDWDP